MPDVGARRILFDRGHAGRRRALLRALGERGLAPRDIDVLVLSHAHWGHVQNADLCTDVLIHPAEDLAPQGNPFAPPWTAAVLGGVSVHPAADGLELAPGVTVTALLTGDAVPSAGALRRGRCSSAVDEAAAAGSMALVRARADLVYPGHDRPFTLEAGTPGKDLPA
ncbi:MBL fold metallo-hydrolase [Amycolatopsis sp. NPDC051758]|uniref:MBL fold metallo-hydrolase n=1 Tax=Amycolatopsis sp. NPDC051758 TaxID=3363935 RepID=UPI0037A3CE90